MSILFSHKAQRGDTEATMWVCVCDDCRRLQLAICVYITIAIVVVGTATTDRQRWGDSYHPETGSPHNLRLTDPQHTRRSEELTPRRTAVQNASWVLARFIQKYDWLWCRTTHTSVCAHIQPWNAGKKTNEQPPGCRISTLSSAR